MESSEIISNSFHVKKIEKKLKPEKLNKMLNKWGMELDDGISYLHGQTMEQMNIKTFKNFIFPCFSN